MKKKWIGFLMALLVVLFGCSGSGEKASGDSATKEVDTVKKEAVVKKPLIDDFRGIKWFTKRSAIPGFSENFKTGYNGWKKKNENNSMGDTPVKDIEYQFCGANNAEEFCAVQIDYDPINYEKLVSFFSQTLNVSPAQDFKDESNFDSYGTRTQRTTAVWDLPTVIITITKSVNTTTGLTFSSCKIEAKKEKSKTGGGL